MLSNMLPNAPFWRTVGIGLVGLMGGLMATQPVWAVDPLTVDPPSGRPGARCLCVEITVEITDPELYWARINDVKFRPPEGITVIGWEKEQFIREGKLTFTVCFRIAEDAEPGRRAVIVEYDAATQPGEPGGTTVTLVEGLRARGSFTVEDDPIRLPPNTAADCTVPPEGPGGPGGPGSPRVPPPRGIPCFCVLTMVLLKVTVQWDIYISVRVDVTIWLAGNAGAEATLTEREHHLIVLKPPQGPENRDFVLDEYSGDIPDVEGAGPCPGRIQLTLMLATWRPEGEPPDSPQLRQLLDWLAHEVPPEWQIAPNQWQTAQGWTVEGEITIDCPKTFWRLEFEVSTGRFRLIREGDRLRLEPEELVIDFGFPPPEQGSSLPESAWGLWGAGRPPARSALRPMRSPHRRGRSESGRSRASPSPRGSHRQGEARTPRSAPGCPRSPQRWGDPRRAAGAWPCESGCGPRSPRCPAAPSRPQAPVPSHGVRSTRTGASPPAGRSPR